jgi:Holliday junction resolvasome RuvABC ATP-dependent DNA helicase subunit
MITNAKEIRALCAKRFSKLVGMSAIKVRSTEAIVSAAKDGFFAPTLIVGTAGLGKTRLLVILVSLLRDILDRQALFFPRGEDCGTRIKFVEECLVPRLNDHNATLAIDECHELKGNVSSLIRSMLNPTAERKATTVRACGDYEITFEPTRQTVIFSTNKVEKLDGPLMSRFERWDLPLYTDEETEQIFTICFQSNGSKIKFVGKSKRMIAECNRGTARDIVHWFNACVTNCNARGKDIVGEKEAIDLIKSRETYPLGVVQNELNTLLHLERKGELQLKELAALNIVSSQEQNANEKYLRQRGFLGTAGKRSLKPDGAAYLASLRKAKFLPETKAKGKAGKVEAWDDAKTQEQAKVIARKGAK